jgi:hypothetical protein
MKDEVSGTCSTQNQTIQTEFWLEDHKGGDQNVKHRCRLEKILKCVLEK